MKSKSVGKRLARERAKEVYQEYKVNGGTLPVSIDELVRHKGIEVVGFKAPSSDLAGALLVDHDDAVIVVNRENPKQRQRFTLAHEFGHFLLHREPGDAIFHRDERSSQGTDRIEIDANAFAAELLMPADEVRQRVAKLESIDLLNDSMASELAKEFGVSFQAMSIRLQQLGIVDIEAYW